MPVQAPLPAFFIIIIIIIRHSFIIIFYIGVYCLREWCVSVCALRKCVCTRTRNVCIPFHSREMWYVQTSIDASKRKLWRKSLFCIYLFFFFFIYFIIYWIQSVRAAVAVATGAAAELLKIHKYATNTII